MGIVIWEHTAAAAEQVRPNILFIVTDDQSHRTVSCYPQAYPWVRTPHLDRLARQGIRFAPAYIGSWCLPARATLLTGRHPTGIQSLRPAPGGYPSTTYDPQQCRFWPNVLREHGYQTAQIGKWHTGHDTGYGRDWDYQVVWNRPGQIGNALNYYLDQLISVNGGEPELVRGYSTDHYTQRAVDYLRGNQRDATKPWCLWLCYDAPHGPFTPAERHRGEYPEISFPEPADLAPPRPGKPAYMQAVESWIPRMDGVPILSDVTRQRDSIIRTHLDRQPLPDTLTDWIRRYHQSVCALDEAVGSTADRESAGGHPS